MSLQNSKCENDKFVYIFVINTNYHVSISIHCEHAHQKVSGIYKNMLFKSNFQNAAFCI